MEISAEPTPNPNALKFTANQPLFESGSLSLKQGDQTEHELAKLLLQIEGVDNIFGLNDFVTVNKKPEADWDTIVPQVEQAFNQAYA